MKIIPTSGRVAVAPDEKESVTAGGIHIPDTAKKGVQRGVVKAVGPGRITDHGHLVEPRVKVGDRVAYEKHRGTEIGDEDGVLLIMPESNIVAIIEDD